jgi:hypothetical protein
MRWVLGVELHRKLIFSDARHFTCFRVSLAFADRQGGGKPTITKAAAKSNLANSEHQKPTN